MSFHLCSNRRFSTISMSTTTTKRKRICPLCKFEYENLVWHLENEHLVQDKDERKAYERMVLMRHNTKCQPCPICGLKGTQLKRHLLTCHRGLGPAAILEAVSGVKRSMAFQRLKQLLREKPDTVMLTTLGVDIEDYRDPQEAVSEEGHGGVGCGGTEVNEREEAFLVVQVPDASSPPASSPWYVPRRHRRKRAREEAGGEESSGTCTTRNPSSLASVSLTPSTEVALAEKIRILFLKGDAKRLSKRQREEAGDEV